MSKFKEEFDRIKKLVEKTKKAGANQVDAFYEWGRNTEVTARDGEVENLTQSVSAGLGLRVFYNDRLGFGYTSDLSEQGLSELSERVFALAKETAADENNGLPAGELLQPRTPTPDIFDPAVEELDNDWLVRTAIDMEKATRAYDRRIKTCDEVGAGNYVARVGLVNSRGLAEQYQGTYVWTYSGAVGEENGQKQSGWQVDYATHFEDLRDPIWVAHMGAWKTVRMLGARKIETAQMPVILEPQMTMSFVANLFSAVNGDMIYKKSSFLLDKLGQQIATPLMTVVDDGTISRRTASCPFDGEGLPVRRQAIVEKGVLKQYIFDTYTANKAGTKPTGTASRGYKSLPSIGRTNLFMEAGDHSPEELRAGIQKGLLVTSMMGSGVNVVNGEYSRGANGILIENGELTLPVQEVTVSGNMADMLKAIDAVGNDMEWIGSSGAPSIRLGELTISGK